MRKKLPKYCNGCANRMNAVRCRGWKDPSGCGGEYYMTLERAAEVEKEIREYSAYSKPKGAIE